ncbi:MAG: toll/interleukin-1 receptor domain-containing protein, partial [Actinomycetota bacterium]|nr:toll/interleukin-1 receptor domain-containing protein [Actinomycetota bacterium]
MAVAPRSELSIFICYRRADTSAEAVALSDKLQRRRGFDVFKDVDNISPGQDWLEVIEDSIAKCDVLLALIGSDWLGVAGEAGHLLDENDHVRLEVEAALARKKAVIPILFENAKMPRQDALPESLWPLLRRHDLRIRNST